MMNITKLTSLSILALGFLLTACQVDVSSTSGQQNVVNTPDLVLAKYSMVGTYLGCSEFMGNYISVYDASGNKILEGTFVQNGLSTDIDFGNGSIFKNNLRVVFQDGSRFAAISKDGVFQSMEYQTKVSACSAAASSQQVPIYSLAVYDQSTLQYLLCLEVDLTQDKFTAYPAAGGSNIGSIVSYPESITVTFDGSTYYDVTRTSDFVDTVFKATLHNQTTTQNQYQYRVPVSSCSPSPSATITPPAGL